MRAYVLCALLLLAGIARADLVVLEDGRELEGEIVRESSDEIEIKGRHGSTVIPRDQIKKIVRKETPEKEVARRRSRLDEKDAEGRVTLARFIVDKRLPKELAAELCVEAWKLETTNAGALELLGKLDYTFDDGQWIAPDKWYPAHNYLRREGRWATIEEVAWKDAQNATAEAQAAERNAEAALKRVEASIAGAPRKEAEAQARVEALDADGKTLAVKEKAARTDLEARETDLRIAADKTVAANQDLTLFQAVGPPADAKARIDYDARLAFLTQAYNNAVIQEKKAKTARDESLEVVQAINAAQAKLPKLLAEAKEELLTAKARLKSAQAEREQIASAIPALKERQSLLEGSEQRAKAAFEARKLADAKAAKDRLEAARKWKKDEKRP